MTTQKVPFGNAMMTPLPTVANDVFVQVFSPPDKALTPGTQAYYELHAWAIPPEGLAADPANIFKIVALEDGAGTPLANGVNVIQLDDTSLVQGVATKVLDGYPVRGDVTLYANMNTANIADGSAFIWGYWMYVGEGAIENRPRRFIGAPSAGFTRGVPFSIVQAASEIVHVFEPGRIDELVLSIMPDNPLIAGIAALIFEDVNNVQIPGTEDALVSVLNLAPTIYGDYNISGVFGGGASPDEELHHLRVRNDGDPFTVHGFFRRS